jgi:hypothetical protein
MMKFRCLPAESQALMNESAKQNVLAKNRNLTAAEAEMAQVKPVTPYAPPAYLDREELAWLKEKDKKVQTTMRNQSSASFTPPDGYRDPNTIPEIPAALGRGANLDIPHITSFIGFNLIQWGSTFSAATSVPAGNSMELSETGEGAPGEKPTTRRLTRFGPFTISGEKNIYGRVDYEIDLHFGRQGITTPEGVRVEFSRSIAFRGESMGSGPLNRVVTFEYNYLDYTAETETTELPANSASAGVYVKIAPLRLAAVALLLYAAFYAVSTSPLQNPLLAPGG